MTSANESAPSKASRAARQALGLLWFGVIPALLAALVIKCWLPPVTEASGLGAKLAAAAREHRIALGALLFLGFSLLARYWRGFLPGGKHLIVGESSARSPLRELLWLAVAMACAAGAALFLRAGVVEPFRVQGVSMLPVLAPDDYVSVNKLAYGTRVPLAKSAGTARLPRRGDVIVYRDPAQPGEDLVKRVIGLPGDHIVMGMGPIINGFTVPRCDAGRYFQISGGKMIDGRVSVEFLGDAAYLTLDLTGAGPSYFETTVQSGDVFVLGDHREMSRDSRVMAKGQHLNAASILGRVDRILYRETPGAAVSTRWFAPLGPNLDVAGTNTRALEEGIRKCLAKRPQQTEPPLVSPASGAGPRAQR